MPMSAQRIRILIADHRRIHREGLRRLLEGEPDFFVVADAGSSADALRLAQQLRPNILLLDASMPGARGRDMLRALSAIESQVRTILIAERVEHADVVSALQLGARGVITKDADSEIPGSAEHKKKEGAFYVWDKNEVDALLGASAEVFNFHYAAPPDTVGLNYGLSRAIGDDETGFRGTGDTPYRIEAWSFVHAGGTAGMFSAIIGGWINGETGSQPVTKEVAS